MHSLCFFSQKADRYPASILCVPSICMRTLSLTGCDVLTYNDWEDNFFFLSIRLCPSPPVVISAEGGLLSPTMLSLSVSLSLSPHAHLIPAHWKKCVCVCVFTYSCCSATSSAFFAPSIFVLYQSCVFFSQISVTPSTPPSSFPFSLPLSTSPQKREKNTPYHWLLWDPVAMQQRGFHMVLARVCVSTVAWQSLDVMLMGKRGRGVELGCEVSKLAAAI